MVEDILTGVIESRLSYLKSNVGLIDKIFSSSSVTNRSRLKSYLTGDQGIKVMRGFPIDKASIPAYCILLGGEQEQNEVIGSYLGDADEDFQLEVLTESVDVKHHNGVNFVQLTHKPLYEINFINYDGFIYDEDFEIIDFEKGIVRLDFDIDLSAANSVSVDYAYKIQGTEKYGTFFNAQYRIETWTSNGDLTVMLYYLLKWMLLSARQELAEKGLAVQILGGLDFEPAPEYFPEFVFRRALTFNTVTESSVDAEFTFIQDVSLDPEYTEE